MTGGYLPNTMLVMQRLVTVMAAAPEVTCKPTLSMVAASAAVR